MPCHRLAECPWGLFLDNRRMASQPGLSDLRRAKFARRVPAALSELAGPEHGTVSLPLHLVWSGLTTFDLDQPRLRMSYYRIVLAEGQHDDLVQYLNRSLLISLWPTLISRDVREVWERSFDELAHSAQAAA
ncbi:hypothetical protein GCM10010207_27720 [Streptomyces atratus]|nr:hypothetical protein GCM10010207_27720 [Streptomyces atratus]